MDFEPVPSEPIDYKQVSKLMRQNVDILKREISVHIDLELERFKDEIDKKLASPLEASYLQARDRR